MTRYSPLKELILKNYISLLFYKIYFQFFKLNQNIPSCIPIGTSTAINNKRFLATSFQSFGTAYGANTRVIR